MVLEKELRINAARRLFCLALMLGLMAVMSVTTYAAGAYDDYLVKSTDWPEHLKDKVVHFNNIEWYIIADNSTAENAGTVTMLAKDPIHTSIFDDTSNVYSTSTVKNYLDGLTAEDGSFADVADAIQTVKVRGLESDDEVDAKLWLLSVDEANSIPMYVRWCSRAENAEDNMWWLRTPDSVNQKCAFYVRGNTGYVPTEEGDGADVDKNSLGVRPALTLKLDAVSFDDKTNTFSVSHVHQFTYTASGATITATCSAEGCTLPEIDGKHTATLTIGAPLHKTYGDGQEAAAVITDANNIQGDAKVKKQKKTGVSSYSEATETAPTDAGTYKASITLGEGVGAATASVEYTIAKAASTPAKVYPHNRAYDGTPQPIVIVTGEPTGGEMQYSFGTASYDYDSYSPSIPQVTDAGTYYVWYQVAGDDNHTDSSPARVTVTISQSQPGPQPQPQPGGKDDPAIIPPTGNTLVYNGNAQDLVTAGKAAGGILQYALGTDAETEPTDGWSNIVPTGTDVGNYFVWWRVKGDANHIDVAATVIPVIIAPEPEQPTIYLRAHVQNRGWDANLTPLAPNSTVSVGTTGKSLRLEALDLVVPDNYKVFGFAHIQNFGDTNVIKLDKPDYAIPEGYTLYRFGSTGRSLRMEAIQINLLDADNQPVQGFSYAPHLQNVGWEGFVSNGSFAGARYQSRRMEALRFSYSEADTGE